MSPLSSSECLKQDLHHLQEAKKDHFKGISLDQALTIFAHQKSHKAECKGSEEYKAFKELVKELRMAKLPFRVIEIINQAMKKGELDQLPCDLRKFAEDPKSSLKDMVEVAQGHEEALQIVESINWQHGTNSACLALLPFTHYKMLPTGSLLDQGIAPMSGEISQGGMATNGVNQSSLSVDSIRGLKSCWEYATSISHSFKPDKCSEQFFIETLQKLEKTSPYNGDWDCHIIDLMRFKQWDPSLFETLSQKYQTLIGNVRAAVEKKYAEKEHMVLRAANYDKERLRQAQTDETIRKEIEEEFKPCKLQGFYFGEKDWYQLENRNKTVFDKFTENQSPFSDRPFREDFDSIIFYTLHLRLFGKEALQDLFPVKYSQDAIALYRLKNRFGFSELEVPIKVPLRTYDFSGIKEESAQKITDEDLMDRLVRDKVYARIQARMQPFKSRLSRFDCVFEKGSVVSFDQATKEMIQNPFPVLIASTQSKGYASETNSEFYIKEAKWGKEVDRVIVRSVDQEKMEKWLATHQLAEKVKLIDAKIVEELAPFALYHSPSQILGEKRLFSRDEINQLDTVLNEDVLPIYRSPYPNGKKRVWHGAAHAVRACFFSLILAEMAKDRGKNLNHDKLSLLVAMAMHDAAREDDGVDRWDHQSGALAREVIERRFSKEDGDFFAQCIAEKDNHNPTSLEQSIIHDGDCLEIIRCLRHPDDFDFKQLRMTKELGEETMLQLVREARKLIALTEGQFKEVVEQTKSPLKALIQVIRYSNSELCQFEMLEKYGREIWAACQKVQLL